MLIMFIIMLLLFSVWFGMIEFELLGLKSFGFCLFMRYKLLVDIGLFVV